MISMLQLEILWDLLYVYGGFGPGLAYYTTTSFFDDFAKAKTPFCSGNI
jgi:hypothetical protein